MLSSKALGLVVSYKKIGFVFPYISLFKTCDPVRDHFWPFVLNLKTPGRSLIDDATYQISRL